MPTTADEFLRWNEGREGKREFVRGRVVEMMINVTRNHVDIATNLLLVVVVTSLYRGRFAGTRYAWVWRTVHLGAYLCWPLAIVHGLTAGRAAPGWVLVCYLLCLFAVAAALVVRLVVTVRPVPEPDEARADTELLSQVTAKGDTDDELAFWSSIRTRS
jgi:hypothetical protein